MSKEDVGYIYEAFNRVDVYRMMQILPIYGVLVDVYRPKNWNGSINGLDTTNLDYEETPIHTDLKVIITNLEHYEDSKTVYESFEEDGFYLKTLLGEALKLPTSSKIVVKDYSEAGLASEGKTFVTTNRGVIATTPVNNKIASRYELTPIYLHNKGTNPIEEADGLLKKLDDGEIVPDFVEQSPKEDSKLGDLEYSEDDLIILEKEGGLYYE